jgi:hypothetical protein
MATLYTKSANRSRLAAGTIGKLDRSPIGSDAHLIQFSGRRCGWALRSRDGRRKKNDTEARDRIRNAHRP